MTFNPDIHHRRSIRLKDYDYSQEGAYYVTICTRERECLLGNIADGTIILTPIGEIVRDEWRDITSRFQNIELDIFIIMPNHLHGIIVINNNADVGATLAVAPDNNLHNKNNWTGTSPAPTTLGDVVGSFKSLCFNKCKNKNVHVGKFWQRNYYERVIRNEYELHKIREYIVNNPLNWEQDENYLFQEAS